MIRCCRLKNCCSCCRKNIGGKRLLSDRQFADVKLEIERRAQATLMPGDEITVERLFGESAV